MRRITMLSLAVAGLFVLASATAAQANWYHKSGGAGDRTSEMTSPSSGPGTQAPEAGTFEHQWEMETGKLPPSDERGVAPDRPIGAGEEIPRVDAGGLEYRVGIDTGP